MELNPLYLPYVADNKELNVEEFNESHTGYQRSRQSPESTKRKKECPACKKIFKGEKAYEKHISKCSKEILCQHCGKVCKSEKKHQEHEQECFDKLQGPLQCKTCKQMFSTTKNLRLLENPRLSIMNHSVFFGVPVFFFRFVSNLPNFRFDLLRLS